MIWVWNRIDPNAENWWLMEQQCLHVPVEDINERDTHQQHFFMHYDQQWDTDTMWTNMLAALIKGRISSLVILIQWTQAYRDKLGNRGSCFPKKVISCYHIFPSGDDKEAYGVNIAKPTGQDSEQIMNLAFPCNNSDLWFPERNGNTCHILALGKSTTDLYYLLRCQVHIIL